MDEQLPEHASDDKRRESRHLCVGIALVYSPVSKDCISDLGNRLLEASVYDMSLSGISFDVDRALDTGDVVMVHVSQPDGSEQLRSKVCWCRALGEERYRIGVKILASEGGLPEGGEQMSGRLYISSDEERLPAAMDMMCPACQVAANFVRVGLQAVDSPNGIMPLYNCSECGTTRTLTGLFYQCRKLVDPLA